MEAPRAPWVKRGNLKGYAMSVDQERRIEANLKSVEYHARRSTWWCWACALAAIAALVVAMIVNSKAEGGGYPVCHPADAHSTALWYVPTGNNTAVELIAYCGGVSTVWHVSFFEGEQPGLWDWYEFQNTASELLRGGR